MSMRRLKMLLRDREVAVMGALAILSVCMWLAFIGHMVSLWRLYLSASYRHDVTAVLDKLRSDTGWGLSNFEIAHTGCTNTSCDMTLNFAYHAPAAIHPPKSVFHVTWTKGKPETYVVQVN